MRANQITVDPFEFIDVLRCDIHKPVNDHATAHISGHISSGMEDQYVTMSLNGVQAAIHACDDSSGEDKVIFYGIVQNVSINSENDGKTLEVDLISSTYLMDNCPHSRTFQDASMTYDNMLNQIANTYDDSVILAEGSGETLQSLIVQYRETDWEFVKRMASHFNTVVIPAYLFAGVKYYFGVPQRGSAEFSQSNAYSMRKSVGEYLDKTKNDVSGLAEMDAIYYQVEAREIYDLAQSVSFLGQNLYIFDIQSSWKGGELVHQYALKARDGFKTQKQYNAQLTGASLSSQIIDVKQDQVKVHVGVDKTQDKGTASWFPYSTAYSSSDGTGWYCMPEDGDAVRLYFPSEKEAEGYIISATHLPSSDSQQRSNPDNKSLMSKYGKQVLFTPNSLTVTNNAGMTIKMLDDEGISIESDKKITFTSDDSLALTSANANLQVVAPQNIVMEQNDTRVILQDNVVLSGAQVSVQKQS